MPRFTRKSAEITAVQVTREIYNETKDKVRRGEELTAEETLMTQVMHTPNVGFKLNTNHGIQDVAVGDFIMQKPNETFTAMKPETFFALYEALEDEKPNDKDKTEVIAEDVISPTPIEEAKVTTTKKYCK